MQTDHKTDGSELAASAALSAEPKYLGDVAFVTRWLRQMAGRVLYRCDEVASGSMTPEAAVEADTAEVVTGVEVFLGEDENFTAMPDWTGTPLADYVRAHLGSGAQGSDQQALAYLFQVFMVKVYGSVGRALQGQLDADALQAELVETVRSLAWLLCGLERHDA